MSILEYLEKHLPRQKAKHIVDYLESYKCLLRITKPRKTKRGDFRLYDNHLSISVNHDNNTFRFLFTLVHEIAHLKTYIDHKHKVKPHGTEWKSNFRELFSYFKIDEEFVQDDAIFSIVSHELMNPKACSGVSLSLEKAFAKYDDNEGIYLEELQEGQTFIFRNILYKKLENRRSRVMCLNLSNKKKYTINKAALVLLGE